MARGISPTALVPEGLVMVGAVVEGTTTVMTVRSGADRADCPECGVACGRVHSRYVRTLADLPLGGRAVRLRLAVRRFRCDRATCRQRIFAERLPSAAPRGTTDIAPG
jgi:transposase